MGLKAFVCIETCIFAIDELSSMRLKFPQQKLSRSRVSFARTFTRLLLGLNFDESFWLDVDKFSFAEQKLFARDCCLLDKPLDVELRLQILSIFFTRLLGRRNRSNNVVKNDRKVKGFHA